jgi:meso-butanediol dehydrogenase/(S,S)-butanediol dehydrogenase/diacetyl reductase
VTASHRIVLVTGGAQNIGAAIIARFAEAGATVICADIQAPKSDTALFIKTDVASESSVETLMKTIAETYGHLDVLVNNAGICIEAPITETREEDWDRVMAVNVKSCFLTTKHAFALLCMSHVKAPAIVNISSIEGPHNIRCNSVAPGWISTPFNEALLSQYPDRQVVDDAIEALHPVGRLGMPEDVADTVYWLAGPESGFITGQEIVVDGGRLARLPLPAL